MFVISVAAELSGMHPQTLRQYDRIGPGDPRSAPAAAAAGTAPATSGACGKIQGLSQADGINLAGIKRILELQDEVTAMQDQLESVRERLERMTPAQRRVFAADRDGEINALRRGERPKRRSGSSALVLWRPTRRS